MKYEDINLIGDVRINGATGATGQVIGKDSSQLAWIIPEENGISGQRYIFVHSKGTSVENGTRLREAYEIAAASVPTAETRITISVMAGYYNMVSGFRLDTPYVDIVSFSGECDVNIFASDTETIVIESNNINLTGINCGSGKIIIQGTFANNFYINCKCGHNGFSAAGATSGSVQGTYIRCTGGDFSFSGMAFGVSYPIAADGTYIDCIGGDYSFGGADSGASTTASGTFDRCIGGQYAFGGRGSCSGNFTKCIGEEGSFSSSISDGITGSLYYCILNGSDFPIAGTGGTIIWCIESSGPATNQT